MHPKHFQLVEQLTGLISDPGGGPEPDSDVYEPAIVALKGMAALWLQTWICQGVI